VNYPDSVHFLYALGNELKTAKFGLERIRALLAALGNPQDRCRFVHVAGTNGKGSTCAMIESALRAQSRHTGLFISPHLQEPTERICLDGWPTTVERFTEAFNRVHARAEKMLDAGELDLHPTYFETVTAMGFLIFEEAQTDIVVLEVGLGGRLDCTNVVHPEISVITQVDFDHEKFLGISLEAIAGEKAGILKPGVPAVFSRQRAEVVPVLDGRAAELGISVSRTKDWTVSDLEIHPRGSRFTLTGPSEYPKTLRIECPLAGDHQVENAVTAAVALARLGVPERVIEEGIGRAVWPGRLERLSERPEIIIDGAHNPAGARALAAYLDRFYSNRRVRMIYGAMRDKAVEEVCGILFPRAQQVIVTAPDQPRSLDPKVLLQVTGHPDFRTAPGLREAVDLALAEAAPEDAIFITGSLYLVGEARALLGPKR